MASAIIPFFCKSCHNLDTGVNLARKKSIKKEKKETLVTTSWKQASSHTLSKSPCRGQRKGRTMREEIRSRIKRGGSKLPAKGKEREKIGDRKWRG